MATDCLADADRRKLSLEASGQINHNL